MSTPLSTQQLFSQRIEGSLAAIASLRQELDELAAIAAALTKCLQANGTIYTAGNGGSAAEALHLAEELIGRYRSNRSPLRAICLNADPTALTCIANDFGFDRVFARQCQSLLLPQDVLVVLSTSGNSPNIIEALKIARAKGATTIGLLGRDGGACRALCDYAIVVAASASGGDSAHIQEAHQVVIHLLCEALEANANERPT